MALPLLQSSSLVRTLYRPVFAGSVLLLLGLAVIGLFESFRSHRELPGLEPNHMRLVNDLLAEGRHEEALEPVRMSTSISRDQPTLSLLLDLATSTGDVEAEIHALRELIRINASRTVAAYDRLADRILGSVLAQAPDPDQLTQEARAALEEVVELERASLDIDPEGSRAHLNLGMALLSLGDAEASVEHLKEALRIDPDLDLARRALRAARQARRDR